ncbi:phytanoyl-CoA dioxygenase family protein [Paenibacillus kobensis]|uniref:phytanoyl-CoA dioxygenase family protein n=1 Tax=Paenibacillus kobensis TaxID=59841 RepID=UPI0013E32E51|nr:phytanoyl-CoA dioxygenase family protein [Paenibacillus kobensis]
MRISAAQRQSYWDRGYTVIKGVFSKEETSRMIQEHEAIRLAFIKDKSIVQDSHYPLSSLYPELHETFRTNDYVFQFLTSPKYFGLVEQLLGEEALAVGTTFFFKPPGKNSFLLHQDNYDVGASPQPSCALWVSLEDTSRENGGLCFIPYSHKQGLYSSQTPAGHRYGLVSSRVPQVEEDPVLLPHGYWMEDMTTQAGDVVAFNGFVVHGSFPNNSRYQFRKAFTTHFIPRSSESVFVFNNQLVDKNGQINRLPLNRHHPLIRDLLG